MTIKTLRPIIIFAVVLVVILLLFYIILFIFSKSSSPNIQSVTTPTPSDTAVFKRNPILDPNIKPATEPTFQSLTLYEQKLPEAKPQAFPGKNYAQTGNLIVTSDMDGVTTIIDQPEGSETSDSGTIPANLSPFKFTQIPAGYYVITAEKENYENTSFMVVIEPNKVTRLQIHLNPISNE